MANPLALITGASSGIGEVFAEQLAHRSYDLILVARRTDRLQTLAVRLKAEAKVNVEVLPTDLTDRPGLGKVEAALASTPWTSWSTMPGLGCINPWPKATLRCWPSTW